jgi:hypothetical protein
VQELVASSPNAAVCHAQDLFKALHVALIGAHEERVELSAAVEERGLLLQCQNLAMAEFVGCREESIEGRVAELLSVIFWGVVVSMEGLFNVAVDIFAAWCQGEIAGFAKERAVEMDGVGLRHAISRRRGLCSMDVEMGEGWSE